jgi:hypothetical protein
MWGDIPLRLIGLPHEGKGHGTLGLVEGLLEEAVGKREGEEREEETKLCTTDSPNRGGVDRGTVGCPSSTRSFVSTSIIGTHSQ